MNTPNNLFWNSLDLNAPKKVSFVVEADKPSVICSKLHQCLDKIYTELNSLQVLHTEAAFISRLIYRLKRKLCHDKGFKALQKINHLLHNYLKLEISDSVKEVKDCIYDKKGPSKQLLQYHLVNILRLSSLFDKIFTMCMVGGRYFKDRFHSGDFWIAAALCVAPISRIWTISMHLVKHCSVWYSESQAYLPYLKSSKSEWLPPDFVLPSSVSEWLHNPPYLNDKISSNRLMLDEINDIFKSAESTTMIGSSSFKVIEDLGESVSRESLVPSNEIDIMETEEVVKGVKKPDKIKHSRSNNAQIKELLKRIQTTSDLINFICKEGVIRNTTNPDSLTRHLSSHKWKEMKKSIENHIRIVEKSKKPKEKRDKFTKAIKCIQYYLYHCTSD